MKTKTNYFTKFITFCVLALFLVTNMIFFTSCDNGNSPNVNTNSPTDYCEICDGVQDNKHQHDYCGKCEGIQTTPHTCPPTPATDICDICEGTQTDASHYFHVETIGGEGSAYKVAYPDFNKYFDDNYDVQAQRLDPQKMMQDFQDNYENYINSLEFSDKFKAYCAAKGYEPPADIDFKTFDEYTTDLSSEYTSYKNNFDYLIGSTTDDYNKSINDICKPIFKDITQNIIATSDNPELDKELTYWYYEAIRNEARKYTIDNLNSETAEYITQKNKIKTLNTSLLPFDSFYQEVNKNGEIIEVINPEVAKQMDLMLQKAADNMGIKLSDAQNMFNVSYIMDKLEQTHDNTVNFGHTDVYCSDYANVMPGVIENTEIEK